MFRTKRGNVCQTLTVCHRATFLEAFSRFWNPISVPLPKLTTTIKPSSPEPTTTTDVTQTTKAKEDIDNGHLEVNSIPSFVLILSLLIYYIFLSLPQKVPILLMFLESIVEEIKMVFKILMFLTIYSVTLCKPSSFPVNDGSLFSFCVLAGNFQYSDIFI